MIKQLIFFAIASILVHKAYRYYKFMGYSTQTESLEEYEPTLCSRKYANLSSSDVKNDRRKVLRIENTLDSDMLPNGICMFSSGYYYPFARFEKATTTTTNRALRTQVDDQTASIYMIDMNYLDQLKPVALDIYDSQMTLKNPLDFNLFAMSIYQDEMQNFKLVAANFNHVNQATRIEKFTYDLNRHVLLHVDSALSSVNVNGLCDLVVVEDYLIYFTKCFGDSEYERYKFNLEVKSGEIWVINLLDNVMFKAASNLFFPKSIAYLNTLDIIAVTNLAVDGISLYKRENDLTLSKLNDISVNSFVFNINVDVDNNLWLVLHPVLHESIRFFNDQQQQIATKLVKLKINFKANERSFNNYVINYLFSTNGSLLNAVGSSVNFNRFLIIFSFLTDPKVCSL